MIDYNRPWHVLDVDTTHALNPLFDAEKFRAKSGQANLPVVAWNFKGNEMLTVLDADWLKYLDQLGILVDFFTIFYRDAHFTYPEAHVDVFRDKNNPQKICSPNIYSLNWVISPGDDSFMTWYDVPFESGKTEPQLLFPDRINPTWKMQDIQDKEFARHTIGNQLTLVRTGIAHNVIVNTQPRWAISLRLKPNLNIVDWKDAVDHFRNNLKLIK